MMYNIKHVCKISNISLYYQSPRKKRELLITTNEFQIHHDCAQSWDQMQKFHQYRQYIMSLGIILIIMHPSVHLKTDV